VNNRERFLKTLRFQSVDHPPLHVGGPWEPTRRRWESEGLPPEVTLQEYFGLEPQRSHQVGIETMVHPPFEERVLEETDKFIIRIDRHGVKVRNFTDDESGMPEHLEYPIKGPESLPWLGQRLDPDTPGRVTDDWAETARRKQAEGHILSCNGGTYFAFLNEAMGTEPLLYTYFDTPDFIHQVNEMLCRLCERALTASVAEVKLDFVGYHEDMAYKTGPLISPDMFREFMMPYYRRVTAITDPAGVDIHYMDSDGNIAELIPLWLEVGINLMSPMEVAAGMDVVRFRSEYGRDLKMIGGFDKRILAAGPACIRAEIARIRPVIEGGGYIPVCDHGIPPDVSLESITCFVETLKSLYGMR